MVPELGRLTFNRHNNFSKELPVEVCEVILKQRGAFFETKSVGIVPESPQGGSGSLIEQVAGQVVPPAIPSPEPLPPKARALKEPPPPLLVKKKTGEMGPRQKFGRLMAIKAKANLEKRKRIAAGGVKK
jgi:hypothetical protein